ncbi:nuclear transport factor 2 family protein [Sphingomonas sp. MMS12-HWE2-04]|uniref:nuclear transport factor 2 family protein n=1 Tax=Sphingomonas sp. MMS12-HWE2-04 TaxID=3234199 RepID=UPI0038505EED
MFFALMLAIALPVQAGPVAPVAATAPSDAAALEALNRDWLTAYKTRDAATLARILADDFEAVYPGGRVLRKADVLRVATNPTRIITDITWDNLKIMVFGDVAVVSARSRLAGTDAGKPFTATNDFADVYVKRDGAWRAISAHVVRAAD